MFNQFKDEANFRNAFVMPLLNCMGFYGVTELHGQQEFGKDFVFSEISRFGFIKYYAAQVKHEKSISKTQNKIISGLIEQVKQAFAVPFKTTDSPREKHISSVFIFNSGTITSGAKEYILRSLEKEHFGDNVHFFDGNSLNSLSKFSDFNYDQETRSNLIGLKNQLLLNIIVWQSVLSELPNFKEARGSIMASIENYLSNPVYVEHIKYQDVAQLWQKSRIIDMISKRYLMGVSTKPEIREGDIKSIRNLCADSINIARNTINNIDIVLLKLRPLLMLDA